MTDLGQVRYVTSHYPELQGIRWIVLGVMCLLSAAEDVGWIPTWLFVAAILPLTIAVLVMVVRYYQRTYGRVTLPAGLRNVATTNMIGVLVLMAGFQIDKMFEPALFLTPIGFAIWVFLRYMIDRRYRTHYLVIALVVVILDVIRTLVAPDPASLWAQNGFVIWVLIGAGLIVSGMLDHLLLSRTLKPAEAHAHD